MTIYIYIYILNIYWDLCVLLYINQFLIFKEKKTNISKVSSLYCGKANHFVLMVSFHNRALLYELTHSIILSVLREFSSTFAPRVDTFSRKWKQGSTLHFFTCLLAKVKGFVWFYSSCHLLLAYPRHGVCPHWLSESQRLLLFLSIPDMSFLWSRITNTYS